jgi:hypothetical protein
MDEGYLLSPPTNLAAQPVAAAASTGSESRVAAPAKSWGSTFEHYFQTRYDMASLPFAVDGLS